MRLNWNFLLLAILVPLFFCSGGCGGISASKSVSPASFFLPGLMKANPPVTNDPVAKVEIPVELTMSR